MNVYSIVHSTLACAPTEVDLFANIQDVSFSDIDNMVATEVIISHTIHCSHYLFLKKILILYPQIN